MLALLAIVLAAGSLGVTLALALRLQRLGDQFEALANSRPPLSAGESRVLARPLEGLRISLAIEQDHPHAVFVTQLGEAILREYAEVVEEGSDLSISGTVVCNGYADVYFTAELICRNSAGTLFTLIERPVHGDRQENLAREVVAKIKLELEKAIARSERQSALRELRG